MKIIYNNIIPFKGFACINLFGLLFVRKGIKMREIDINHEAIHTAQMKELLYIPFYIIYLIEWLIRVLFTKNHFSKKAYYYISFEREAYRNQWNLKYLEKRKHFAEWRKDNIYLIDFK